MLKAEFFNRTWYCGDGCCASPDGFNLTIYDIETNKVVYEYHHPYGRIWDVEDAL